MDELIEKLGIDWRLLIANTITFFIVLWVLKKYAFGPLMRVIEERQASVAANVAKSEEAAKDVQASEAKKATVVREAKVEAQRILAEAKQESEEWHVQLQAKAKKDADDLMDQTRRRLDEERQKMIKDAKKDLAELVVVATEKVISQRLDHTVEERLATKALRALERKQS